ncbi:glycosyltransferase involved in cell wall biosynthesis [Kutzneria viridogrisea]|nr:glycosyltransferase family 2 protein [Kutzneria albida]MBA8929081.1 glycosyltransferase involved in cell wall biosynthesis [Kutzneria viridogrisea]
MSWSNSPDNQESLAGRLSLSVVIPVFNEEQWITRSVTALLTAAEKASWPIEVVLVDDGSTDDTPARLAELSAQPGVVVVTQANSGRFAARQAGLRRASGSQVLLLDSRVIVDPDSLSYLREQLTQHPDRVVWNGHVNVATDGSPYGAFWSGLVTVAWRRYLAKPELMSFGAEDFDAFPKGTGFFTAPREVLLAAAQSFSSLFDDPKLASDDTRMIRSIAESHRIHISPSFSAEYHSRDSLQKFVRHAYFRGTTFIDSYLDSPGPVRKAAAVAAAAGVGGLVLLVKRPKTALAIGVAGSAAAAAVVRRSGGSTGQAKAVGTLLPLFAACFGAGAVRGLTLAVRKRLGK